MLKSKIVRLGEQMLNELYKKSVPSITWKQFVKKYKGTEQRGFENYTLFDYEAEEILAKYKKKVSSSHDKDCLGWLWLDFCPVTIPTPGSDKAIELGCTCAVLDNCRGAEWFGKVHGFWVTGGCPVHDKKKVIK